jgi:rhodanese-related sulfurtransferase
MGDPVMCTSCISPAYFHGTRESGDGPFAVTNGAVTNGVMRLTLEGKAEAPGIKFRGFLLKVPSGSLEMVSDTSQYKDCTGVNGANGNSPGGTGLRQAATQTDVDAKKSVSVDWVLPSTQGETLELEITAIFLYTSEEWYGFVQPISVTNGAPDDNMSGGGSTPAVSEPRAPAEDGVGRSGYAELTLERAMPASGAETESFKSDFISELATTLSISKDRVQVSELKAGSVVIGFLILPSASAADKTAKELLHDLTVLVDSGDGASFTGPLLSSVSSTRGLVVLSDGQCATSTTQDLADVEEECSRCKPVYIVLPMIGSALLFAASTVLLCMFCLLCKRAKHANLKTPAEQAAAYEKLCQRYDRGTKALQIEPRQLMEKIKGGASVTILDTRSPAEHAVSCLQGPAGPAKLFVPAQLMSGGKGPEVSWATPGAEGAEGDPLEYLKGRGFGAEGSEELIVCHCTAGFRSGYAAANLQARLGRPVYNLHGGIIQWANEGGEIVDPNTKEPTNLVNPFSQQWGQYVKKELKVTFEGRVRADLWAACLAMHRFHTESTELRVRCSHK